MPGLADLDDHRGGIVPAANADPTRDESARSVIRAGIGGSEEIFELFVVERFDQAIGADQKAIAFFAVEGSDLWRDELVAAAESLLHGFAARVVARFAFVDFAVAEEPADVGVIFGELGELGGGGSIDSTVTNMTEIHAGAGEPAETEGGFHAA